MEEKNAIAERERVIRTMGTSNFDFINGILQICFFIS
jgi:hypothetical protein